MSFLRRAALLLGEDGCSRCACLGWGILAFPQGENHLGILKWNGDKRSSSSTWGVFCVASYALHGGGAPFWAQNESTVRVEQLRPAKRFPLCPPFPQQTCSKSPPSLFLP